MRKRHFASPAEGPPSRLAKRGSESGSRQQQPEDVPDIPGAAPEERLIYQQMVDSFSVDHRPGGGRSSGGGGAAAGRMSNSPPPSQPPGSSASSSGADKAAALASRPQRKDTVKRKTNLELFKEELKAMQEKREQRKQMMKQEQQPAERRPKSRFEPDQPQVASQPPPRPPSPVRSELSLDPAEIGVSQFEADKDTTNLFLGNLHPEVTERDLMDLFGRFGPLASVKIMWPRTEVERSKKRNCGFVAYMCRRDSERAVDRLRDRDLMGYQMLIGWGKSVPIPTYPIYVPPMLQAAIDPPPVSGLPFNAQPKQRMAGDIVQQRDAKRTPIDLSTMSSSEQEKLISEAIVKVTVPADRSLLSVINRMVEHVVREGPLFELLVCQRESDNPRYRFLFDYNSAEHVYYRWRLYSILHGDTAHNWRLADFRMYKGGSWWRPPPINVFTAGMPSELIDESGLPPYAGAGHGRRSPSPGGGHRSNRQRRHGSPADSAAADDKDEPDQLASARRLYNPSERPLSEHGRAELSKLLAGLTTKRQSIAEAMVWCLEHAESALEIVDSIASAVTTETEVEPERRLSALFLASDLLHNSAVKLPCAAFYRTHFQPRMPRVFARLGVCLQAVKHRQPASSVIRAWSEWALYQPDYLMRLNNAFLGLLVPDQQQQQQLLESVSAPAGELEKDPSASRSPAAAASADLDGQPLLPGIADYDGDPLDVDGQPLALSGGGGFTRSKWAALDASGGSGSGAGLVSAYDSDGNSGESD
uniref:U2 snRNP-associated SURP motif-containing protein n=1 Tax=Macrostomum lignano TaxID=282301 RepID=A0A1I8HFL7_9PLAT